MMASAAAGTRRPPISARLLSRSLPWLFAYDRRDVVTIHRIFHTLETRMARRLADGHTTGEDVVDLSVFEACEAEACSQHNCQLRRSNGLFSGRASASAMVADYSMAFSVFAHSLLIPCPGDDANGMSLQEWLVFGCCGLLGITKSTRWGYLDEIHKHKSCWLSTSLRKKGKRKKGTIMLNYFSF